ncbi:MAG: calcium-binding protein [Hyphomicrobiaceae bacterium]|nr:calcium-binding protein [Hyphomicrobiaceae bacterium]
MSSVLYALSPLTNNQQLLLAACKKFATKAQLILAARTDEGLVKLTTGNINAHAGLPLVTTVTYYNDQNIPCDTGLVLNGNPYNIVPAQDGSYHQTFPLVSPSTPGGSTEVAAAPQDPLLEFSIATFDNAGNFTGVLADFSGIQGVTNQQFLDTVILPIGVNPTYEALVALLDDATAVAGSEAGEHIEVGAGNDTVTAGGGDDVVLKWKAGNLAFDGGAGSDTLDFHPEIGSSGSLTPIVQQLVVDLSAGTGQNPYGGTLSLVSVENVVGTSEGDIITGSSAANVIGNAVGENGPDVINALGGDDIVNFFSFAGFFPGQAGATIDGGTGVDTFYFQYDFENGNRLDLANQANNAGMFRASTFTSFERFVVGDDFASAFGDLTFIGDGAANYLSVRQGKLAIDLAGGNDTLVLQVASTSDPVTAAGGAGTDRLVFEAQALVNVLDLANPANNAGALANATFSGFEQFELAANSFGSPSNYRLDFRGDAGASFVQAGAGADSLAGGGGNDTLVGGAGGDRMDGGTGHDTFYIDQAGDLVVEAAGQGTDRVHTTISKALFANVESLILDGGSSINGSGNALANTLIGNAGANVLDGRAGADRLFGHGGNDTYILDNVGDVVGEVAGNGTDTVKSTITYALGDNVEKLLLLGATNIDGTGNGLDNVLVGNNGANRLDGGLGVDNLTGGLGSDTLTGGLGNDRFLYTSTADSGASSAARDRIVDFTAGDRIWLNAIDANELIGGDQAFVLDTNASFSAGEIRQTVFGSNLLIEMNTNATAAAEMSILLLGRATLLAAADFVP